MQRTLGIFSENMDKAMTKNEFEQISDKILRLLNKHTSLTHAEISLKAGNYTMWQVSKALKILRDGDYIYKRRNGTYSLSPKGCHAFAGDWNWSFEKAMRNFSYDS